MTLAKKPTPFDQVDPQLRRDMAAYLRDQYLPIAFRCECGGSHPTCARVRNDDRAWAQFDVLERIARWLEQR